MSARIWNIFEFIGRLLDGPTGMPPTFVADQPTKDRDDRTPEPRTTERAASLDREAARD